VPIGIFSSNEGILQTSNLSILYGIDSRINLNVSAIDSYISTNNCTSGTINVPINFTATSGDLYLNNLNVQFWGDKLYEIVGYSPTTTTEQGDRVTGWIRMAYSLFGIYYPQSIEYFDIYAWSTNQQDVQPFGQTKNKPIWKLEDQGYTYNEDLYFSLNETFNACLSVEFCNNSNFRNGCWDLNTSGQLIFENVSYPDNSSIWARVDLNNCPSSGVFYIDEYLEVQSMCNDCEKVTGWED